MQVPLFVGFAIGVVCVLSGCTFVVVGYVVVSFLFMVLRGFCFCWVLLCCCFLCVWRWFLLCLYLLAFAVILCCFVVYYLLWLLVVWLFGFD